MLERMKRRASLCIVSRTISWCRLCGFQCGINYNRLSCDLVIPLLVTQPKDSTPYCRDTGLSASIIAPFTTARERNEQVIKKWCVYKIKFVLLRKKIKTIKFAVELENGMLRHITLNQELKHHGFAVISGP